MIVYFFWNSVGTLPRAIVTYNSLKTYMFNKHKEHKAWFQYENISVILPDLAIVRFSPFHWAGPTAMFSGPFQEPTDYQPWGFYSEMVR